MKQSKLAGRIGMSPTIAIDEKVRQRKAAGETIYSFGAGQPDAPTPDTACDGGIEAIRSGKTKYTSPGGTLELREAICRMLQREKGLSYEPDDILVAAGAKQAIYVALAVVVDPGDEILVPTPYWVSYPTQIEMLGGIPKFLETDESTRFKIGPEELRGAIGPRTRGILINSPSNPTGSVYSRPELEALMEVVAEHDLYVISDEIYERIVYGGVEAASPASVSEDAKIRTAVVNGVSKAYSMTGWRIGYYAARKEWAKKGAAIQSQLCGNACSISQSASVAALEGCDSDVARMLVDFTRRRDLALKLLSEATDLEVCVPDGAFYIFPDFSHYYGRRGPEGVIEDDLQMASYLIDEARAALVPGSGFGSNRHLRISYATSDAEIESGLRAVVDALARLSS